MKFLDPFSIASGLTASDIWCELSTPDTLYLVFHMIQICHRDLYQGPLPGVFRRWQTLYDAESSCDLLAASHFEGDDGLYLVYGQPRAYGGFVDRKWCCRQHTTVGFRDFLREQSLLVSFLLSMRVVQAAKTDSWMAY